MLDKFSWLHISDFHFTAGGDPFSQNVSCEALVNDIPSRLSEEYPLQFTVVTGDIASSGKDTEYAVAEEFFNSLTQTLELDFDRICIVAGNHDVDRSQSRRLYQGVKEDLIDQQSVDEFLGGDPEFLQLMKRQSAFTDFRDRLFPGGVTVETDEGLARLRYFDLDGFRICILELNTAWLSGHTDRLGNLLMGERQVINALSLADERQPHLTIALTHHPSDWLSEFDQTSCFNRLNPRLDIFHSGHIHRQQVSVALMPGTQCLNIAAGSSHETRHYRNSYNLIEYDVGNAICRIRHFEYRIDAGVFEEAVPIEHTLPPAKDVRFTSAEIASALCETAELPEYYADYLAAILSGDLNEIPISLESGETLFASRNIQQDYQLVEVQRFLRIANLIGVDGAVQLRELISTHSGDIQAMVDLLSRLSSEDHEFADALASRASQARRLSSSSPSSDTSYQELNLEELSQEGNISGVIDTATRYSRSSNEYVQKTANRYLVSALIQSDDEVQRAKGARIAFVTLDQPWADSQDYVLASVAAESLGDYGRAECTALIALQEWPDDPRVLDYCRSLATQTGSQAIRRQLDENGGNTP